MSSYVPFSIINKPENLQRKNIPKQYPILSFTININFTIKTRILPEFLLSGNNFFSILTE